MATSACEGEATIVVAVDVLFATFKSFVVGPIFAVLEMTVPDAVLAMEPIVFRQMREHVATAEAEGTDSARLRAYEALKAMIAWLSLPAQP